MRQSTLASQGFVKYPMKTRKVLFLEDMNLIIPWSPLVELIEPFYPKPQGAGRCPIGMERMLRIYFLQHWYGLCDPAVEEALYDMEVMRKFVGIDLGHERVVDEITICKFRRWLESQGTGGANL